jgi:WW domain-binding protein 4
MSEFWISKKKYFCKYCDIYIADDAPSRTHHENGMRHQGNKERFVKGLYKAGEKKKKEEEEEKREMKNVEAAAQRAFALDVGAGRAGIGGSGSSSAAPRPKAPPPKMPSNPYANYTTAEFLGYKDLDAERIQAEFERKRSQGVAGDWELVPTSSVVPPPPPDSVQDINQDIKPLSGGDSFVVAGTKRDASTSAIDNEDTRAWKLKKKTARLGEIYDPGVIPIKIKAKNDPENTEPSLASTAENGTHDLGTRPTDLPKWTTVEWKKPGGSYSTSDSTLVTAADSSTHAKPVPPNTGESSSPVPDYHQSSLNETLAAPNTERPSVEFEDTKIPPAAGSLFKKRKGKPTTGGTVAGRGRT